MSMCRQEEFVAIVSAMQASERDGKAYDPTRKFQYGLWSNNIVVNNGQQQKVVTEECRARMLNWCLDVSISYRRHLYAALYSNFNITLYLLLWYTDDGLL